MDMLQEQIQSLKQKQIQSLETWGVAGHVLFRKVHDLLESPMVKEIVNKLLKSKSSVNKFEELTTLDTLFLIIMPNAKSMIKWHEEYERYYLKFENSIQRNIVETYLLFIIKHIEFQQDEDWDNWKSWKKNMLEAFTTENNKTKKFEFSDIYIYLTIT
jgi:hypothetical protein